MSANKTELISDAFVMLGLAPVTSPDTDNPNYKAMSDSYERLIPALLSQHPWRFAMVLGVELSKLLDKPAVDRFSTAYQLPTDMLLIYRLEPLIYYEIFENKLYTNESGSLKIDYLFKPSENRFPFYFGHLVSLTLASEFSLTVTQNANIAVLNQQRANLQLAVARSLDSSQMMNRPVAFDGLYAAHFAGRSSLNS